MLVHHLPDFKEILNTHRHEGGFLGHKSFKENPLGQASKTFREMQGETEEINKRMLSIQEDIDMDKEESTR